MCLHAERREEERRVREIHTSGRQGTHTDERQYTCFHDNRGLPPHHRDARSGDAENLSDDQDALLSGPGVACGRRVEVQRHVVGRPVALTHARRYACIHTYIHETARGATYAWSMSGRGQGSDRHGKENARGWDGGKARIQGKTCTLLARFRYHSVHCSSRIVLAVEAAHVHGTTPTPIT